VAGGVGVDGSAEFLGALAALQRRLLHIALIGAAATAVLALFFAKSITRPIARLVQASERIGHGRLDEQIPPLGKGEIGALAETMEAMRQRVVGRERELKAMVAGVAHEIRNPLGGIELFVGLLSDGTDSLPESQRHVEKIAKEVRYLKDIVDRFLEYARPADPQREPCRIGPVLHEVEALLEPEFRRSGAEISVAPSASSLTARIDPNHFKRIVLNLARNAVAAMPQGGRFTVSAEADERRILIRFADTGTGIAPDAKPKIFSPFFTTREKGTGLGLSIVKGLAESNGGHITLLRSDTGGTVFELDLEKV
jgi:signal transduction histidine kinase